MKFGKLIQALIDETLPAWKDKFLAYKYLKKRLNSLIGEILADSIFRRDESVSHAGVPESGHENAQSPSMGAQAEFSNSVSAVGVAAEGASRNQACGRGSKRDRVPEERGAKRRRLFDADFKRLLEMEFKRLLEEELEKLNDFVVDKEEEYVIRLQDFKERAEKFKDIIESNHENHLDVINLRKDVVVFHGEMVLLKNYSSLNYTGLVKIVKKHDKLMGAWLRLSFIPDVLQQPFYTAEILSRLVQECESNLLSLFPSCSGDTADNSFEEHTEVGGFQEDLLFQEEIMKSLYRSTTAALQTMRNMGRGSSTYNLFSVPPCEDEGDMGSVVDEEVSGLSPGPGVDNEEDSEK